MLENSPAGQSVCQENSPFSTLRSVASGIRKPYVMASMNGGHFLMVRYSPFRSGLKALGGKALNQSGRPSAAGIGRGKSPASSGGHRNVTLPSLSCSTECLQSPANLMKDARFRNPYAGQLTLEVLYKH